MPHTALHRQAADRPQHFIDGYRNGKSGETSRRRWAFRRAQTCDRDTEMGSSWTCGGSPPRNGPRPRGAPRPGTDPARGGPWPGGDSAQSQSDYEPQTPGIGRAGCKVIFLFHFSSKLNYRF